MRYEYMKKKTSPKPTVAQAKIILAAIIIEGRGYAYWNPKLKAAVKKFMDL
jgi:hypothetical protein